MYYNEKIQKSLDFILNKAWCHHTFQKAALEFNKIYKDLLPDDRYCIKGNMIELDPSFPDCTWHGKERGVHGSILADAIKSIKNRKSENDPDVKKLEYGLDWAMIDDGKYPIDPYNDYEMRTLKEKDYANVRL